jgi:ABC-type Fe3+/spermidine/putrescine transport system ATPase subunit
MIDLQHISKTYPLRNGKFYALRDVTLHVNPGEFLAIHGASGAGKSTLLNIIGCMDDFSDGRYLLEGADAGNMPDHKKSAIRNQKIGFVLQDFALVNDQTVLYNVMLPLLFGNTPFRLIRKKAAAGFCDSFLFIIPSCDVLQQLLRLFRSIHTVKNHAFHAIHSFPAGYFGLRMASQPPKLSLTFFHTAP